MLKTPAISSSRRKAVETSSCRNVSSQLDEYEEEADEEGVVDQKVEPALMYTRRKVDAVKKESAVQKAYSTRRSTRVTEKKSAETRVKKDSGKAVKIDSFIDDEVNVESEETNVVSGRVWIENIHCSDPLQAPSGKMDKMLKDHDRQVQEAVRRARDKTKVRNFQAENPFFFGR